MQTCLLNYVCREQRNRQQHSIWVYHTKDERIIIKLNFVNYSTQIEYNHQNITKSKKLNWLFNCIGVHLVGGSLESFRFLFRKKNSRNIYKIQCHSCFADVNKTKRGNNNKKYINTTHGTHYFYFVTHQNVNIKLDLRKSKG